MKEGVSAMREKELMSFILCKWTIIRYDWSYNLMVKKIGPSWTQSIGGPN